MPRYLQGRCWDICRADAQIFARQKKRYLHGGCRDICTVDAEIFARQMPRYLHNVTRKTKVHFWQYYSGCWTPPALLSKHSSPIIIHGNVFIWYPEGGKCIFLYKVFRFWIVPEISLYRYTGECGGKRLHKKFQEYCVNVYILSHKKWVLMSNFKNLLFTNRPNVYTVYTIQA